MLRLFAWSSIRLTVSFFPFAPDQTVHFWGPVANWGFVLAGLLDLSKPPEKISGPMAVGVLTLAPFLYFILFYSFLQDAA